MDEQSEDYDEGEEEKEDEIVGEIVKEIVEGEEGEEEEEEEEKGEDDIGEDVLKEVIEGMEGEGEDEEEKGEDDIGEEVLKEVIEGMKGEGDVGEEVLKEIIEGMEGEGEEEEEEEEEEDEEDPLWRLMHDEDDSEFKIDGFDLYYLRDRKMLGLHPTFDIDEAIDNLREKVESIEWNTTLLYKIIDYLTKDPELLRKLEELQPPPMQNEKTILRRMLLRLETRISNLEKHQKEEENIIDSVKSDADSSESEEGKSRLQSFSILDSFLEPQETNARLQSVYGGKTNGEVIDILRAELKHMIKDINSWNEEHLNVNKLLGQMKSHIPSGAPCACVYDVKMMKMAINIMTGGRFEKGEEIIFLNPNKVRDLEERLANTGARLKSLEEIVQQMRDFSRKIKAITEKFAPYLRSIIFDEPLPGKGEQKDIGLNALQDRIQVLMADMKYISDLSDQLLQSQCERDLCLAGIKKEIERLRQVKVDKEDVEDILTEKADPKDCNIRIDGEDFIEILKRLAIFNNICAFQLAEKEMFWRRVIIDVKNESETKALKEDLKEVVNKICNEVTFMISKLREVQKNAERRRELSKQLDGTTCVSCGTEIRAKPVWRTVKYVSTHMMKTKGMAKKGRNIVIKPNKYCPEDNRVSKRYCGSSHTITTPEQRLARQIRPECLECRQENL